MAQLSWHRRRNGWLLKAANGDIWGVVTRNASEGALKNQFRATALHTEARSPRGRADWTTRVGMKPAKAALVELLQKRCWEEFRLAA